MSDQFTANLCIENTFLRDLCDKAYILFKKEKLDKKDKILIKELLEKYEKEYL